MAAVGVKWGSRFSDWPTELEMASNPQSRGRNCWTAGEVASFLRSRVKRVWPEGCAVCRTEINIPPSGPLRGHDFVTTASQRPTRSRGDVSRKPVDAFSIANRGWLLVALSRLARGSAGAQLGGVPGARNLQITTSASICGRRSGNGGWDSSIRRYSEKCRSTYSTFPIHLLRRQGDLCTAPVGLIDRSAQSLARCFGVVGPMQSRSRDAWIVVTGGFGSVRSRRAGGAGGAGPVAMSPASWAPGAVP